MIDIEKRLRCGWRLQEFLKEFHCNSEEELFNVLRKRYSRKTVKGYISKMKKNLGIKKHNEEISENELNEIFADSKCERFPKKDIETISEEKHIKQEKAKKKRFIAKMFKFFKGRKK